MKRLGRVVMMILSSLAVGTSVDYASAETVITPSVTTAVSYYSNALFTSTADGTKSQDVGLTFSPQFGLVHSTPLVSAVATAGVTATRYLINDFGFVGINAGGSVNLTNLVQKYIPRLTLSVSDYFNYTPQLPGFLAPTLAPLQGEQTAQPGQPQPLPQQPVGPGFFGPGAGAPQGVNFNGNFAARANSYTNGLSVGGGYSINKQLTIGGGYAYTISHFGDVLATPGVGGFFDTETHSFNVGPSYQLTPADSVSVSGGYTHVDYGNVQSFAPTAAGVTPAQSYDSYTGGVSWTHRLSQTLTGSLGGNYSVVSPGNDSVYGGNATLSWLVVQKTTASVTFSRSVAASYVGFGSAMVSNSLSAGITRVLTPKLSANATLLGTQAESVSDNPQSPNFRYESIIGGIGLNYALSRYFSANAFYSHSWFKSFAGGTSSSFNFDSVTIGISGSFPYRWS